MSVVRVDPGRIQGEGVRQRQGEPLQLRDVTSQPRRGRSPTASDVTTNRDVWRTR